MGTDSHLNMSINKMTNLHYFSHPNPQILPPLPPPSFYLVLSTCIKGEITITEYKAKITDTQNFTEYVS